MFGPRSALSITISDRFENISVKDNGRGIPQADLTLIGQPHCTSKLKSFADIENFGECFVTLVWCLFLLIERVVLFLPR